MAGTTGTLELVNGDKHHLVLSTGDKIRAGREAAKKGHGAIGSDDKNELMLYSVFLAAQRLGIADATGKEFLDWCDTIVEFDLDITADMIDGMLVSGQIDEKQAELMRAYVKDDAPAADAAGEAEATPAT